MELYGGIDLHGNNNHISLVDKSNHVVATKRLHNELLEVLAFLEPHREDIVGLAVESTYNWYWLVDGLMGDGYTVHLANPAAMKQYNGLKHTDDKTDSRWIAHMLSLGILPEGYIYPRQDRPIRDLLRKRGQLVQQRTGNILSINNLFNRNIGKSIRAREVKRLTEEELQAYFLHDELSMAANSNLVVVKCLEEQIKLIERRILELTKLRPEFKNLLTAPGIGEILALTISLETGDVRRFEHAGNFSSYCRCVRSDRLSNNKKKGEGNRKNGNKYLSWAFAEAATFSIRYSDKAKRFYQRKMAKKNVAVAHKALANKLAKACYFVMRDNVPFDEDLCFAT